MNNSSATRTPSGFPPESSLEESPSKTVVTAVLTAAPAASSANDALAPAPPERPPPPRKGDRHPGSLRPLKSLTSIQSKSESESSSEERLAPRWLAPTYASQIRTRRKNAP